MDYYRSLDASTLDADIPTVFELLAVQQLQGLIQPSVRFLVMHYAERHPAYLLRIANKFDELFALTFGLVEYYHLKGWNSSFTERFYGMKRARKLTVPSVKHTSQSSPARLAELRRLTKLQRWLLLTSLIAVPYVREKTEARYERLRGRYAFRSLEEDYPGPDSPLKARIAWNLDRAILSWWPRVTFGVSLLSLGFTAAYTFHNTGPSSIEDWLFNTRYARLSQPDYERMDQKKGLVAAGLASAGYALPAALFVLKFLEWWNASEFGQKIAAQGPQLGPPRPVTAPQVCGVCGRPDLETPTALESGAMFCYKCIYNKLSEAPAPPHTPTCPSTGRRLLLTVWDEEDGHWKVGGLRRIMV